MSKRGAFIVIEGLDRSGKSTQAETLLKNLQDAKIPSKLIKFPDRSTPIGKLIDSYLRSESELDDHAIHLLFSANRWEVVPSIVKDLEEGTTIICDRYAFSGIAFSASKVHSPTESASPSTFPIQPTPKLTYEWCRSPDISLPAPDLTLFLDILPEKAKARGGYGEERYEKEDVQERVREVFIRIGEELESSGVGKWVVLDGGLEKEEVEKSIWDEVNPLTAGLKTPIQKLWDQGRERAMESALYI
ncbi:thymidylate kinase [Abortiporus biennis]|nr:thymidylate kinase [Abortiporus biennis]